jgi:hypothetical protein
MTEIFSMLTRLLHDVLQFCEHVSGIKLREYQKEVAQAIVDSIVHQRGHTIVVMFPRQSGKNELQAQVETYLLALYSQVDAEMVKVSPTWKPQTQNAMRRLERVLKSNLMVKDTWTKEAGYVYRVGMARIFFLSGSPTANVVGATASVLIECDEAQDVMIDKWDKDFSPMVASTNATRVFWGTAWTSRTLLARELRAAQEAQKRDGMQRVFRITADEVMAEVPAYGVHVCEQVARLGRNHPMVLTQYYSEEIDEQAGMFPPERLAKLRGDHQPRHAPEDGKMYALLVDVGGEARQGELTVSPGDATRSHGDAARSHWDATRRDSTAVTVVELDPVSIDDPLLQAPTYRVMERYLWTGASHVDVYGKIKGIVDQWEAKYVVVDSTGVGAGLASFLERAYPGRVIAYQFTAKSKSLLGWGFLAVVETGRFKDYEKNEGFDLQDIFFDECAYCGMEVGEGPDRPLKWGVPDGTRNAHGDLVHDDMLISAALCWVLDKQEWGTARAELVAPRDIFEGMAEVF